jgi:hypothetical protein
MMLRLGLPLMAASLLALPLFAARGAAEPAERISGPAVHENIAVYFVHGSSAPGPVPLTLQEALAKSAVEVLETGNVQELKIRNTGAEPVFVQFGDIVKGGQQDRVLTVSMVIEPGSGLIPIGSYCVEQGRWAVRGKEDARRFALSDQVMPWREAKLAMARSSKPAERAPVAAAAAERNQVATGGDTARQGREQMAGVVGERRGPGYGESAQSEVWRSVSKVQDALTSALKAPVASEASRTSLQLALEHDKLRTVQDAYFGALQPAGLAKDDIVGIVVAVNGKLTSADVYPSNGLFRKMWPKLARAAVTEAVSAKAGPSVDKSKASDAAAAAKPAEAPLPPPALEMVSAFLADAEKGKASERAIADLARLEARESDKALRVEARSAKGAFVHRNYLAK